MVLLCGLMIPITSSVLAETPPAIPDTVIASTSSTASDATAGGSMGMDRMQPHFVCGLPTFAHTSCWKEDRLTWRQRSERVAKTRQCTREALS